MLRSGQNTESRGRMNSNFIFAQILLPGYTGCIYRSVFWGAERAKAVCPMGVTQNPRRGRGANGVDASRRPRLLKLLFLSVDEFAYCCFHPVLHVAWIFKGLDRAAD